MQSMEVPRRRNGVRSKRHHSRLLTLPALLIIVLSALVGPSVSLAATPTQNPSSGVHVDPGSPAAKQYAIPLSTARGGPAGTSGAGSLFGAGISRKTSSTATAGPTRASSTPTGTADTTPGSAAPTVSAATGATASHATHATYRRTTRHRAQAPPRGSSGAASTTTAGAGASSTPPPAAKVLRSGSGSGLVWMLVAAALVMILGATGSFALTGRRRRAPSGSTPSAG